MRYAAPDFSSIAGNNILKGEKVDHVSVLAKTLELASVARRLAPLH